MQFYVIKHILCALVLCNIGLSHSLIAFLSFIMQLHCRGGGERAQTALPL